MLASVTVALVVSLVLVAAAYAGSDLPGNTAASTVTADAGMWEGAKPISFEARETVEGEGYPVSGWGFNEHRFRSRAVPISGVAPNFPSENLATTSVTQVANAGTNTYALLSNGTVEGWGENGISELCGANQPKAAAAKLPLTEVKQVAAQAYSALFLKTNNTVEGCGSNGHGQLGYGERYNNKEEKIEETGHVTGESCRVEEEVEGHMKAIDVAKTPHAAVEGIKEEIVELAGSGLNGYALLASGKVEGWGVDNRGQLGANADKGVLQCKPVAIKGLEHVVRIAAGTQFALALLEDGRVMAWGNNETGELGNGVPCGSKDKSTCFSPEPLEVKGLSGVTDIAAGNDGLAVTEGKVMAWGKNVHGELGDGIRSGPEECNVNKVPCSSSPQAVCTVGHESCTSTSNELTGVKDVSAGGNYEHTGSFGLALIEEGGTVDSWGSNEFGQLGNGEARGEGHDTAVQVRDLSDVQEVVAGAQNMAFALGPLPTEYAPIVEGPVIEEQRVRMIGEETEEQGEVTDKSSTMTKVASFEGIAAGYRITGPGLPQEGCLVSTVEESKDQLTMACPAKSSPGIKEYTFEAIAKEGTFTLSYEGDVTKAISATATAAEVAKAVGELKSVEGGVEGKNGPLPGSYVQLKWLKELEIGESFAPLEPAETRTLIGGSEPGVEVVPEEGEVWPLEPRKGHPGPEQTVRILGRNLEGIEKVRFVDEEYPAITKEAEILEHSSKEVKAVIPEGGEGEEYFVTVVTPVSTSWDTSHASFKYKCLEPDVSTLSSTLSTEHGAITSLPVKSLSEPIARGREIELVHEKHTQTWEVTAEAKAGATTISVASQTPNFAYPAEKTRVIELRRSSHEFTAKLTEGSATLTSVVSFEGFGVGELVNGPGVPAGAIIEELKPGTGEIKLSKAIETGKSGSAVTLSAGGELCG